MATSSLGPAFLMPQPDRVSDSCRPEVTEFLVWAWGVEGRAERARRPKNTLALCLPFLRAPVLDQEIKDFGAGRGLIVNLARDKALRHIQEAFLEGVEPLVALLSLLVDNKPTKTAVAAHVERSIALLAKANALLLAE